MAETANGTRVVVTGLGAITAQGTTATALWENVRDGNVAIRDVGGVPLGEGYLTTLGGEVKEEVPPDHDYLNPDGFHDRAIDFTMKAAEEAMEHCGVGVGPIPGERWGIVVGTCNAGLLAGEEWYAKRLRGEEADPRLVLLVPPQAMAEALSGAFGIKGPVLSVDTACAASANAIGYASELVRSGQADAVLTGGTDAFSDVLYSGFNALESLSPEPAAPYSADRKGLSLGEGSAMLVVMREDLAREHGAQVLAEIAGYGLSADGYHPTAPHPEGRGASRAIKAALRAGGVSPDQVDYVNSHGTGTAKNDPAETAATKVGLGDHAYDLAVSSTKSMIGHLLGGAGAAEALVTVEAIQEQVAPPTANYTEPDPECDLDYVPNDKRDLKIDFAVSNNFAFGGANASIVFVREGVRDGAPPELPRDEVVITGLAAMTPAGTDVDSLWKAYADGSSPLREEDGAYIGRVDFKAADFMAPKERKRVDRLGQFSIISTRAGLEDAGIQVNDENAVRIGCIIGTGVGPMESMEDFAGPVIQEGPGGANPAIFPNTVYNAAGGQVAIKVGLLGPASTVCAGHAAGASALVYGADITASDQADAMVCLGADTLTDTVIAAYKGLGALASSPPGSNGGGFGLSEAGVAVVCERASKARERGARVYGKVLGYGITADGTGIGLIDKEGEGIERAMRLALERAGVEPGDVAAVWAAANGFATADEAEEKAIGRVLGDGVEVLRPKLLLGEPMGAGAELGVALALKGWDLDDERSPKGPVLVNSLSLGGTNFSIALAPADSS